MKHAFAVETIANPRMSGTTTLRIARDVEWEPLSKLVFNDFGEMGIALVGLGHERGIIIKIVTQGFGCRRALRATPTRRILHIDGYSRIVHQQRHSIFLLCSGRLAPIIIEHVGPIIMRLAEIGFALRVVIIHCVAILPPTLRWPAMEIHDLRHRRGHTSCHIARFLAIRIALSPLRAQQRCHPFGKRSCGFRSPNEPPTMLQLRVNLPIGLQQIARLGVEPRRIHLPPCAIGQHFAHGIVARHHNEAVPMRVVDNIIR